MKLTKYIPHWLNNCGVLLFYAFYLGFLLCAANEHPRLTPKLCRVVSKIAFTSDRTAISIRARRITTRLTL